MAIDVLSANVLDGFSNGETAWHLTRQVAALKPDAAVFLEAYAEGREDYLSFAQDEFNLMGYDVVTAPYDDADGRADKHGIMAIARTEVIRPLEIKVIRFAGRAGVGMTVFDESSQEEIDVYGLHMDDRSEGGRLEQAYELITFADPGRRSALVGDLNAMHGSAASARLLRLAGPIAKLLPVSDPGESNKGLHGETLPKVSKLARIGSLATRLTAMADGATLAMLEQVGFRDADGERRPTMPDHWLLPPVVQLDHVMVSRNVDVLGHQTVALRDEAGKRLTDHLAVRAQLRAVS